MFEIRNMFFKGKLQSNRVTEYQSILPYFWSNFYYNIAPK